MADGPEITSGSGLRRIQIFALDTSGYIDGDQADIVGYDGINMEGARSFSLNIPDVTRIQHVGNDRVFAQDFLPPTEGASGTITTGKQNLDMDSVLTGTEVETVGEMSVGGLLTNKQGNEIDVAVIGYRQALDTTEGSPTLRRWQMHIFPTARLTPRAGSAEQGSADENTYTIIPSVATQYPWGHAFTDDDEGFTEAQYLRATAEYPVVMDRWDGNNTVTEYTLTWTPISTDKMAVFADGVAASVSSVDTATPSVTLSAGPDDDCALVAVYETSDDI